MAPPEGGFEAKPDVFASPIPSSGKRSSDDAAPTSAPAPKLAFVQQESSGSGSSASPAEVQAAAARGTAGGGGTLPHQAAIQQSFGGHDVSGVRAHTGAAASEANAAMGANAYASGNNVAFRGTPSLYTAAHEAAHVIQQRKGVQLQGGVGASGDAYEKHADAVASKVVAGESAEGLLDTMGPKRGG